MVNRIPRQYRRFLVIGTGVLVFILGILVLLVQVFVEPTLRKKIHTLIIDGSDSLYQYKLGELHADLLGGDIEVEDLDIYVDSARYKKLELNNALPTLTMQVSLKKGHVKGIGILSILFSKKISVEEIMSSQANIRLSRHYRKDNPQRQAVPLWKSMRPKIKSIEIERLKLDGVKLLYRNADTSESMKLQFDRFDAVFNDIQIDSAAAFDTSRISFAKDVFLKFHDLKYRSADSTYKLKAEWITYSSKNRSIDIDSFKLQPTLEKEDFYANREFRKTLYYLEFDKVGLRNISIDKYLHENKIEADSIIIQKPDLEIYLDKKQERLFSSKIGKYPHQQLLRSQVSINIKNILLNKADLLYTEKNGNSGKEGNLPIEQLDIHIKNITNQPAAIEANTVCTAEAKGYILGSSALKTSFKFYLDSVNGRFDVMGSVESVSGAQINTISDPLANVGIPSLNITQLDFSIKADDYTAWSDVNMRYDQLAILLKKQDKETGYIKTMNFMTRVINNHVIYQENPSNSIERQARNVKYMRLTTQSFFGVIWKALFAGMQEIMMKT